MKSVSEPSYDSLRRFISTNANATFGLTITRTSYRTSVEIAVGSFALGLALSGATLVCSNDGPHSIAVVTGIGALLNFFVSYRSYSSLSATNNVKVPLTKEAKNFYFRVGLQFDGVYSMGIANLGQSAPRPEILALLDKASFAFNRVLGVIDAGAGPTITSRIINSSRTAAEESMIEIWNAAAMMEQLPESGESHEIRIELLVEKLNELGDRLSTMVSTSATPMFAGPTSSMDSLLDELRLDRLARQELHESPELEDQNPLH